MILSLNLYPGNFRGRLSFLSGGDMVEKMQIKRGGLRAGSALWGRAAHTAHTQVIKAEIVTGLLYTWVVGPNIPVSVKLKM